MMDALFGRAHPHGLKQFVFVVVGNREKESRARVLTQRRVCEFDLDLCYDLLASFLISDTERGRERKRERERDILRNVDLYSSRARIKKTVVMA